MKNKTTAEGVRVDADVRPPIYELSEFKDFLKIPIDKLSIALAEFSTSMLQSKAVYDIAIALGAKNDDFLKLPMQFIDDDKGEIKVHVDTTIRRV